MPKNLGGRPTKLTPELMDLYLSVLPGVYFLETAAELCGIHRMTVNRWMKRGEKALSKGLSGDWDIYRRFYIAARKATAEKLKKHISAAETFAETDPKHLQWLIEKISPDLWGDQRHKIAEIDRRLKKMEEGK
jgi:hypothetical protein